MVLGKRAEDDGELKRCGKLTGTTNEIKLLLRRIWGIREREDSGMC